MCAGTVELFHLFVGIIWQVLPVVQQFQIAVDDVEWRSHFMADMRQKFVFVLMGQAHLLCHCAQALVVLGNFSRAVGRDALHSADQDRLRHDESAKHEGCKKLFGWTGRRQMKGGADRQTIKQQDGDEGQSQKGIGPFHRGNEQGQQGHNAQPNHDGRCHAAQHECVDQDQGQQGEFINQQGGFELLGISPNPNADRDKCQPGQSGESGCMQLGPFQSHADGNQKNDGRKRKRQEEDVAFTPLANRHAALELADQVVVEVGLAHGHWTFKVFLTRAWHPP